MNGLFAQDGQNVKDHFPFYLVKPPFVDPALVEVLTPQWDMWPETPVSSVVIWGIQNDFFGGPKTSSYTENDHVWFSYECIGKTDHDVYVLLARRGLRNHERKMEKVAGLLFVTFETDTYAINNYYGPKVVDRVLIKRVGSHCLGERWSGEVFVKGQTVIVHPSHAFDVETIQLEQLNAKREDDPSFFGRLASMEAADPFAYATHLFYASKRDFGKAEKLVAACHHSLPKLFHLVSRDQDGKQSFDFLLDYGMDVNVTDDEGNTPLHYAIQNGRVEAVQELLAKGASVNATNHLGETPLFFARYCFPEEMAEILNLLLKHNADCCLKDSEGRTLLSHLLDERQASAKIQGPVECLIAHGAKLSDPKLLVGAVMCNSFQLVKDMIAHGVDVNVKSDRGTTPLHAAVQERCSFELCTYLIEKGADASIPDDGGFAAIYHIIRNQDLKLLEKALEHKMIDLEGRQMRETPLYTAVENQWAEGVKMLVNHGVDVNVRNNPSFCSIAYTNCKTPLYAAVQCGSPELAKFLIESGAEVDKEIVSLAQELKNPEILQFFRN